MEKEQEIVKPKKRFKILKIFGIFFIVLLYTAVIVHIWQTVRRVPPTGNL